MPKRMLDDSYLNSPSLDRCSPRAQDAFPRFILLADDFGCFEADPRRLLALGWSSRRSDVRPEDVWAWLEEYVAAGMACLWSEKERRWCYLTGWDGPHGQRRRAEYDSDAPNGTPGRHGSKRRTPRPPADLVAAVVSGARRDHDGQPPGTDPDGSFPAAEPQNSRAGNGGNAAGSKSSDSNPVRESAGSVREIRGSAAPVAVPVPVPGADAAPAGNCAALAPPTPEEHYAQTHPGMTALAVRLDNAGLRRSDGRPLGLPREATTRAALEAAVSALGLEAAAAKCMTMASGRTVGGLGYFASGLTEEAQGRARGPPKALHLGTAPASPASSFTKGGPIAL